MTLEARFDLCRGDFRLSADVTVADGEVLAVLGPNGAGKSTLLRTIAGLEAVDSGRILIDDVIVDEPSSKIFVSAAERNVGFVFQDYLLFDHLSVLDNVAFGSRSRGTNRRDARRNASELLERFGLSELAERGPRSLSGGQAQRVALTRALATSPRVLLMDEPLAALDVATRREVRQELRHRLEEFSGAVVIVTHDPIDAYALADRLLILENGTTTQIGTIAEVTSRPQTRYAAELVGRNLVVGTAHGTTVHTDNGPSLSIADEWHGPVFATIRPQAVTISRAHDPLSSSRNSWTMRITGFETFGERIRVHLTGPLDLVAEITNRAVDALGLRVGDEVNASVKATEIEVYER
jgi:molybdate transport system ATP-binding protein